MMNASNCFILPTDSSLSRERNRYFSHNQVKLENDFNDRYVSLEHEDEASRSEDFIMKVVEKRIPRASIGCCDWDVIGQKSGRVNWF